MLCASHCKSLSILKVLRVPLSFSLFNFQGPTHFLESFLSVLTEPLSTVRELLYHIHFRLSTLFSKFLKSFLKSLSLLFKILFLCFQTFLLFVLSSSDFVIISPLFTNCNPFFQFFQNFLNFLKKWLIHWLFRHNFFQKSLYCI